MEGTVVSTFERGNLRKGLWQTLSEHLHHLRTNSTVVLGLGVGPCQSPSLQLPQLGQSLATQVVGTHPLIQCGEFWVSVLQRVVVGAIR